MQVSEKQKSELIETLNEQILVIDAVLAEQTKIHTMVKEKNWTELMNSISNVEALSNRFVELDELRENLGIEKNVYYSDEISDLVFELRTKLTKSKIENQALAFYVNAAQGFINGVLDKCIPQQRNTLYTNKGVIRKPQMQSVIVNKLM